eukprot:1129990-Amphidinium_carterae.1
MDGMIELQPFIEANAHPEVLNRPNDLIFKVAASNKCSKFSTATVGHFATTIGCPQHLETIVAPLSRRNRKDINSCQMPIERAAHRFGTYLSRHACGYVSPYIIT